MFENAARLLRKCPKKLLAVGAYLKAVNIFCIPGVQRMISVDKLYECRRRQHGIDRRIFTQSGHAAISTAV